MAEFTPKSKAQLDTISAPLKSVLMLAKAWTEKQGKVDWQISQGARTIAQQQAYFDAGNSKVNPKSYANPLDLYKAAKHVVGPDAPLSRAADIFVPGQPGGAYDKHALCYIQGVIIGAAASLAVKVRSGLDFDRDGLLLEQGSFQDAPHIELD